MDKTFKKSIASKRSEKSNNECHLMTRTEIIDFLKTRGIQESQYEELDYENMFNSGSLVSIYDFERRGWDTPY